MVYPAEFEYVNWIAIARNGQSKCELNRRGNGLRMRVYLGSWILVSLCSDLVWHGDHWFGDELRYLKSRLP